MKILYLCHRIPYPPDKGDKIRSFHQVRQLGERHSIALVAFVDDPADLRHVTTLREWCASVDVVFRAPRMARLLGLRGLLSGRSLSVEAFDSGRLRRLARERGSDADVVIAFSSVMAQHAPAGTGALRIADFVDIDSEKWRIYAARRPWPLSWIYRLEADRLGRFEGDVARSWDRTLLVSEREARSLRALAGDVPMTIVPLGVDTDYFTPAAVIVEEPAIVFTGAMDYFPNVDAVVYFCDEILPRVRASVPAARFTIVGRHPSPAVSRLGGRPGVTVTGGVDDVRPYLRGAALAVAPLRIARGVQSKVLEAMATGLPVVVAPAAMEGLGAEGDAGLEVADGPERFAAAVVGLLLDANRRRDAGTRARAYVERHHRWEVQGETLERLIAERPAGRRLAAGR